MKLRSTALISILGACLLVGAISVSNAGAFATTTAARWYTGTSEAGVTELTGFQAMTASSAEHPEIGQKTRLKATVGLSSTPITLTSSSVSCLAGCVIDNREVTVKAGKVAQGEGELYFGEVSVVSPATCSVEGGQITTNRLIMHGDLMEGEKAMVQFQPIGTEFARFKLINKGMSSCPIAGYYFISGTLFAEARNKTGKAAATQGLVFSPAINKAAGGELKIGSKIAEFTGSINFSAFGKYFTIK